MGAGDKNARQGDEARRARDDLQETRPVADLGGDHAEADAPRKPSSEDLKRLSAAGYELVRLAARGKAPVQKDWNSTPADNLAVIDAVERHGANAGVRIGPRDLVIDVDPKNGGTESLARLVSDLGLDLSTSPTTLTGSGGAHYYLRRPEGTQLVTNLRDYPGIDFKSSGQVVAPGSIHPNGKAYDSNFEAHGPGDAPAAPASLLSILERRTAVGGTSERAGELTPKMLAANLAQLDPDDFAEYSNWLNLMMACHHATAGEGLDEFTEWSICGAGYADAAEEIAYKWGGLTFDDRGVTVKYLYRQLHDRGLLVHDRPDPEDDFDPVPPERNGRWRFLCLEELESLPPPAWLVPGLFVEGSIAAIYGAPESGKSFLAVDVAMSIATGIQWHGREVSAGAVLYVAAEGAPGIGKRVRAWRADRGVTSSEVPFVLMRDPLNLTTEEEARDFALAVSSELGPLRMIVVDTLNQTAAGADENSAQDMGRYIAGMKQLRDATGATVVVVHHSGKDASKGMRGSTALPGAFDTIVEVDRASDGRSIKLMMKKQKDAEHEPPMRFDMEKVAGSLVLRAAMIADPVADFATVRIRAMARELAKGGRVALKELVAALCERDGVSDKTARRRVAEAIPEGRESAVALDDSIAWTERADGNPRGEVVVMVELNPGCRGS